MSDMITAEAAAKLLDSVKADREVGTEDHWWHSQICDFYLADDFGAYDDQKACDKRRILRVPALERTVIALHAQLAKAEALRARAENWKDDPESNEAWCAGNDYALTRLCKVLGVDPDTVSWDGSDGNLDEEADALIWRILHANDDEEGRSPAEADRDRLAAANAALEAQVARLEAALRPFAQEHAWSPHSRFKIVLAGPEGDITGSDMDRARAALAAVQADARRDGEGGE